MDINFELYKVFYYVATIGSFSGAARKLFISQSAISQSIRTLENKLGTSLFIRNTKQISLTHEGSILYNHIEPAFNLINSGEKKLTSIKSLESGEIRIAVSDTICKYYLLPFLKRYHEKYPKIHMKITNRTSTKCVNLLKDGKVDFIITNLPNEDITSTMEVNEIFEFNDVFVAGGTYSHMTNKLLPLRILEETPLIMLEKHTTTRKFIDSYCNSKDVFYNPEIELTSIDLMMEFAKIGLGITFIPDFCLTQSHHSLEILHFTDEWSSRKLGLVINKKIVPSFTAQSFIEFLQDPSHQV